MLRKSLLVLLVVGVSQAMATNETWDDAGAAENGWGPSWYITYHATGGNPGGFIDSTFTGGPGQVQLQADADATGGAFVGDYWATYGDVITVSCDVKKLTTDDGAKLRGFSNSESLGKSVHWGYDLYPPGQVPTEWTHHEVTIDKSVLPTDWAGRQAGQWHVWGGSWGPADWEDIMANVQWSGLSGPMGNPGSLAVDNYQMVPEPATLCLLALGLPLLRRRK